MKPATPQKPAAAKTALGAAIVKAGLDTETRLREIEARIVADNPGIEAALDVYYATISDDAAALWHIFAAVRREYCLSRLRAAYGRMQEEKRGASETMPSGQARSAPRDGVARGQRPVDDQLKAAPRPTAAPNPSRVTTQGRSAAGAVIARSIFDKHPTPFGRPIGHITGLECRAWHTKSRRDTRITKWLSDRVPPDGLVLHHVDADELAEVIRIANRENDND